MIVSWYNKINEDCQNLRTGTPLLYNIKLKDVLETCTSYDKSHPKHIDGCLYMYNRNMTTSVVDESLCCAGVCCVDLDNLNETDAEQIFNNFEMLADKFKPLLAIQYSHSYFAAPENRSHGVGMHIFVRVQEGLNNEEYKYTENNAGCIICYMIFKYLGIKTTPDSAMRKLTQKCYMHYSPYKWNEYAEWVRFSLEGAWGDRYTVTQQNAFYDDLKKMFGSDFLGVMNNCKNVVISTSAPINSSIDISKLKGCKTIEYGQRWQISAALKYKLKLNKEQFYNFWSHFYSSDGKSLVTDNHTHMRDMWSKKTDEYGAEFGYQLLVRYGLLKTTESKKDKYYLSSGEYITKFADDIIEMIKKNNRSYLVAPTGCGKTYLINNIIAEKLNCVVIGPYNDTNKLYNKLYEISTVKETSYESLPEDKPVIMCVDQAVKHIDDIKNQNRIILYDESQTVYTERDYRPAAAKFIELANQLDLHICCISATPTGELGLLQCKKGIKVSKGRNIINVEIQHGEDIEFNTYCDTCMRNKYDKIVLFSDETAEKIYQYNLCNDGDDRNICYMRASRRDRDDYKAVIADEIIRKKLTIATRVAYNGLNFNNENENILVVVPFYVGESLPQYVVQCIGRFRKCNVDVRIVVGEKERNENIDYLHDKAVEYKSFENSVIRRLNTQGLYDEALLDDEYIKIRKELADYSKENGTIENLKKYLVDTGYMCVSESKKNEEKTEKRGRGLRLPCKKSASDKIYEAMRRDEEVDESTMNEKELEYWVEWKNDIMRMNSSMCGVDIQFMMENAISQNKSKQLQLNEFPTLLQKIHLIVDTCLMNDEQWLDYVQGHAALSILVNGSKIIEKSDKTDFFNQFATRQEYRQKYYNKIRKNIGTIDAPIPDPVRVANIAVEMEIKKYIKKIEEQRAINGAKGGKKGKSVIYEGKEYDSCEALSKEANVSKTTITKWIKNGKVKLILPGVD